MELFLIRHTKPAVDEGVCYGRSDIGLDDSFIHDLEQLQGRVATLWSHPHWVSSPSRRCNVLAEALAMEPVERDPRLLELDFGRWEMLPWSRISRLESEAWCNNLFESAPPDGESYAQLYARVESWLGDLQSELNSSLGPGREQRSAKELVAVTHAGPIRAALSIALGAPPLHALRIAIDYGSITRLRLQPGAGAPIEVVSVNSTT